MATAANAEVLPIAITAQDNSAAAWQSFKRHATDAKGAVDQLRSAIGGLEQGSASGISGLANLAKYAKNPYVLLALAIAGVGLAGQKAASDLAKIGDAADSVGIKASAIAGLGMELKKVGGGADDAISGLRNLRTQLDLNGRDGGYLEKLFKLNGSSINDAAGRVKSVEQVYGELSRMIQGAANETERLEIATAAFGEEAAPKMVKAILAGNTSLEKLGQANIDPLVQQSRELALIWDSISKSGDGWFAKLKNRLAEGWGAIEIGVAALAGSQRAQQSLFLMNNPNAQRSLSQNDTDRFYDAVRGRAGTTRTPGNGKPDDPFASNEFDRAINAVTKHIALMQADADAVGQSAGEHERLRVEAQLLDAAQRKGGEATEAQRKQFKELADAAKIAADQLAFARLQNDLMFERGQLGRSDIEQTIAARLRGAGIDAGSDQAQFLAQQIRINESLKYTQDIAKDALKGFISDLRAGKSDAEAFSNVLDRIATRLLDSALNNAISGLTGGLFGGTGGTAGTMSVGTQSFPAFGFHRGGIVGAEPTFLRAANSNYRSAPRYHDGLMPDEFKAVLKRKEGVFTEGQMAALGGMIGGGAPTVNVTLVESPNANGSVTQRQNGNGFDIEIAVAQIAAKSAATPGGAVNRVITDQLGGRQRIGSR